MEEKSVRKKNKKELKKAQRLKVLIGVDLCACAGGHKLRCNGVCRESHRDERTGQIVCEELYNIQTSEVKSDNKKRPKRDWKYGRQKDIDDNKQGKQNRREKIERDSSRGV